MQHERFVYSPIINRPKLEWPNGARLAVWVVPNVEHYEYLPKPGQPVDPFPRMPHPDVLVYSTIDYGNRVGFWRMLEIFDKYEIPTTCSLNLAVYEHFPEIMEAAESRAWEVLCHGIYNTLHHWDMSEDEERHAIADCVDTHKRLTGRDLLGFFAPYGAATRHTPDLLAEFGIKYFPDWGLDDQPTPIRTRKGALLALPYSFDVNDGINFRGNIEAEAFAKSTIDLFDRLHADSETTGRVMCVPTHPFFLGQPHRLRYLDMIFKHICGHGDVWMATGGQITDWYMENYYPTIEPDLRSAGFFEEMAPE